MGTTMWVMVAILAVIAVVILYTRQFKWILRVGRNMILGAGGILAANLALANVGLAVGINLITTLVIGVLGIPGFLALYLAQLLVG